MDKPTVPQISFFRRNWFRMTREEISDDDLAKLKTKADASAAISKLNEIRQRWAIETKSKMEKASPDERIGIAHLSTKRVLTEEEREEVLGQ